MKKILLAALLALASCTAATQPATDGEWGKWGDPNYARNEYHRPEAVRTTGKTPIVIGVGWGVKK